MSTQIEIDIRPSSSLYGTYRRLSYKPWYALAEFIDNSTQSFFNNKKEIMENQLLKGKLPQLRVEVMYNSLDDELSIYDNAFGMEIDDFTRALVLDRPPLNNSGRSEFGMGLKTAACWFGSKWTVESTQLGSENKYIGTIDTNELINSNAEKVTCHSVLVDKDEHYTRITIRGVLQPIKGRTVTKVQAFLASMYREDLRSGHICILWNGVPLSHIDPEFYSENDNGQLNIWRKDISFSIYWPRYNKELKVSGWIGIRKSGKISDAGFILLRRGRVIVGGPDAGYKPTEIFGQANSFRSQRLIGELILDNWPVTQAKDGFEWSDGLEDELIGALQPLCKEYGDKAESIRAHQNNFQKPISKPEMEAASKGTEKVFQDQAFTKWLLEEMERRNLQEENGLSNNEYEEIYTEKNKSDIKKLQDSKEVEENKQLIERSIGPLNYSLPMDKTDWKISLYWQNEVSESYWISIGYPSDVEIDVYINLLHPFFSPYIADKGILELIQKFVISMALAEKMSIMTSSNKEHLIDPFDYRLFMNRILSKISNIKEVQHGTSGN